MINHVNVMALLKYLLISIPMISAMTCGIVFMIVFPKSLSLEENRIKQTLGSYYFLIIVLWFVLNTSFHTDRTLGLIAIPIYVLLMQLTQVTFYHFLCYIIPYKDKFNTFHYKMTVVISLMSAALVYLLNRTHGFNTLDLNYFFYQYMYVYSSFTVAYYTMLSCIRLYKSQKQDDGSSLKPAKYTWVYYLLLIRIVFALLFIFNNNRIAIIDILTILLITLQHILVTFNVLQIKVNKKSANMDKIHIMIASGHIVSVDDRGIIEGNFVTNKTTNVEDASLLTEVAIIDYFSKEKPYLNKDFKLGDLVTHFGVNRTYISKFINTTFNCNISQYINSWRLKEVKKMQDRNLNSDMEELVIKAGFSNYKHYLRAKEIAEK